MLIGILPLISPDLFDVYDRTKQAFAVLLTAEPAKYGNIILKKGVTPTSAKENL